MIAAGLGSSLVVDALMHAGANVYMVDSVRGHHLSAPLYHTGLPAVCVAGGGGGRGGGWGEQPLVA